MTVLLILNRLPYDGTDVTWNALRLAQALRLQESGVRIFLMNDAVNLARPGARPEGAEFDLGKMLLDLEQAGAEVKLCTTCITRCGLTREALATPKWAARMTDLARWVTESDRVLTF